MGFREKVALLLIAVIFQKACTECKRQSLTKNPFERYVGKGRNGKNIVSNNSQLPNNGLSNNNAKREVFTNANMYKTLNFPEVEFPSDTSHRDPALYNYGSVGTPQTSPNKKYDPALLDSYKKEARKKRKSKKQVKENIPIETQLKAIQPSYMVDKGAFPEVEYPMNAMDTWMPKYWNTLPYNMDEPKQNDFSPNAKQINMNTYVKPNNRKLNNEMLQIARLKENKNKVSNPLNPSGSKNSKMIVPMKSETKFNKKDLLSTYFKSSPDRQLQRKLKKRKKIASRNKLNNNRNILTESLKPCLPSKKLLKTETDSNKNTLTCLPLNDINNSKTMCIKNNLSKTMLNTTINAPPNTFTNGGKVDKPILFPSSSNTDNLDKADPLQIIAGFNSSELNYLIEQLLTKIGPVPKEYELPADFSLPNLLTFDNLAANGLLPENISDLSLISKYLTSDNLNENINQCPTQSDVSDLTALYYLVEKVLDQIDSQQNNFDTPNDISTLAMSTGTLPTESIIPNPSVPDKINDQSITNPTEYVLPDSFNMNDKPFTDSVIPDYSYIPMIPENYTTTDSLPFCPLPTIDQCSIFNTSEPNISNNTVFTLIDILNGSTPTKISETPESVVQQNVDFEYLRNDSKTVIFSNDSRTDNVPNNDPSDILKNETLLSDGTLEVISDNGTIYDAKIDLPKNETLADKPANDELKDMAVNDTLSNMPDNNIPDRLESNPAYNQSKDNSVSDRLSNMPGNEVLEDTQDSNKSEEVPEYDTLNENSDNQTVNTSENDLLETMPVNDTLSDMPDNYTLNNMSDITDNKTFAILSNDKLESDNDALLGNETVEDAPDDEMPEYNTLSDNPEYEKISDVLDDETIDIPDNSDLEKTVEYKTLSDESLNETLEDKPVKNTLGNIPVNDTSSEYSNNDTLEDISEYNDKPDSDNASLSNSEPVYDSSDNTKREDTSEYDTLSDISHDDDDDGTLNSQNNEKLDKLPELNTLSHMSDNNNLEKTPDMPYNETSEEKPANEHFEDIPAIDTLSSMPNNDTSEDISEYNDKPNSVNASLSNSEPVYDSSDNTKREDTSEYDTLSDISHDDDDGTLNSQNNEKLDKLPELNTLSDISDNNNLEKTPDMPYNETSEEKPANEHFEDIPASDTLSSMPNNDTLGDVSEYDDALDNKTNYDTLSNMAYDSSLSNTSVNNNNPDIQDSSSNINDVEVVSIISDNRKFAEIKMSDNDIMAGNEPLNNFTETNVKSNNEILSNISNANTDANDFNGISNLSDLDKTSDIFNADIKPEIPFNYEIADWEPNISNTNSQLDTVKLNITDIDELVDILLALFIEDLKTNMEPDT